MYCWEDPFKKIVEHLRNKELKYQRNIYSVSTFNQIIDTILPSSITFTSITFFIYFTNLPLLPTYIVLAMSYYLKVSSSIGYFFTQEVTMLIGANVSVNRIQSYLLKDEVKKNNSLKPVEFPKIILKNLTASWSDQENKEFKLKNLNFEVNKNELTAIIGPVGAGKTSILLALLEELQIKSGDLKVEGSVFYVPQEPWIFTASIRQNILFGKPYDDAKFKKIIKVCCLEPDLNNFDDGDKTIVGEKGINLSGGQRARINLGNLRFLFINLNFNFNIRAFISFQLELFTVMPKFSYLTIRLAL